jgi:hypothetical protein
MAELAAWARDELAFCKHETPLARPGDLTDIEHALEYLAQALAHDAGTPPQRKTASTAAMVFGPAFPPPKACTNCKHFIQPAALDPCRSCGSLQNWELRGE